MAHPKVTKRLGKKLWHLEDKGLKRNDALAIKRHLIDTEDKNARLQWTKLGYQVWWSKR